MPIARLFLPPAPLSACLFGAILRDTRGTSLSDADRLNHFPASPLVALSCTAQGQLFLIRDGQRHPAPRLMVTPPQPTPTTSWSPGDILALSIGIYPEAWAQLDQPATIAALDHSFTADTDPQQAWAAFCAALMPLWQAARAPGHTAPTRAARLSDWSRSLITRAALAGPGRSLRALERRLKRLSGQTRQTLDFFASFEDLHRLSLQSPDTPLAQLALDAGYADQSHMGRAVRRATGFSPARLNRLIQTQESFWCYRLLGERF